MSRQDDRDRFRRLAPPRAPDALRERVLAGARGVVASSARPSRTDRIWYSRTWRLAWVIALAALILLETLSVRGAGGTSGSGPSPAASIPESAAAAKEIGLPEHGWIGAQVVTTGGTRGDLTQESL